MIGDFKTVIHMLRRNGFQEVQHVLMSKDADARGVPGGQLTELIADGHGLWTTCAEVLLAYENRGRRLQQALLGERTEERCRRDGRVHSLLHENSKLQEELKAAKELHRTGTSGSRRGSFCEALGAHLAHLQGHLLRLRATGSCRSSRFGPRKQRLQRGSASGSWRNSNPVWSRLYRRRPSARSVSVQL